MRLYPHRHHASSDHPEVYLAGLVILALPPGPHSETRLEILGQAGPLTVVEAPQCGTGCPLLGPPVEESWWLKTWTRACGPEENQAELQRLVKTEPLDWVWQIWW